MLNALRLTDGVPASLFAERTGYPLALVARALEAATRAGLLERRSVACSGRPTLGRRFLNDLQRAVPAAQRRPGRSATVAPLVRIEATGVER